MLKKQELADPNSCLNRAKDGEMIFVILERDVAAPYTIRMWAAKRIIEGKNKVGDEQITTALSDAEYIQTQQRLGHIVQAKKEERQRCAAAICIYCDGATYFGLKTEPAVRTVSARMPARWVHKTAREDCVAGCAAGNIWEGCESLTQPTS